jgi:hypothetical protein
VATVRFAEVDPPPRSYLASLRRAESAVADFASYTLADNTLLAHYRLALASARATGGWADDWGRARAWSREVTASVGAQRRLIAVSSGSVTFTSQRGEVPVTVVNGAEYPVRVRIDVSSAKLRFPEGNDRVLDPLAPPGETVTFAALADATGTFPITVRLSSPDGRTVVATDELLVRSTAANVVGLALTAGGAAFLAVWYGRRIVTGRRRHGRDVEERRPGRGSRRRSFAGEQPHRREQDGEHRA